MKIQFALLFIFLPCFLLAQGYGDDPTTYNKSKLAVDRIDDMTGISEKRTNWNTLVFKSKVFYSRFSKLDSVLFLDFKAQLGFVTSIETGEVLYIKFENNEVKILNNLSRKITGRGDGAIGLNGSGVMGVYLNFLIDKNILEYMCNNLIVKIRLVTTDGYIEENIAKGRANTFIKDAKIMLDEGYK